VAREVADEFQASLTATLINLVKLDILPIVIVCHNRQRRRWFRRANMVPGWWFPREDLDAESFAFGMLFGGVGEDRSSSATWDDMRFMSSLFFFLTAKF
jgi:hypothetical protein